MTTGTVNFVIDADLHGLVDGFIEPGRRGEALRRLAGAPAERARVEAWQSHNELLRGAFAGVEREPLPPLLDLKSRPRLHCIPAGGATPPEVVESRPRPTSWGRVAGFTLAVLLLVVVAFGTVWTLRERSDPADTQDDASGATSRPGVEADAGALSNLSIRPDAASPAETGRTSDTRLPTSEIPDLASAGFAFEGADVTSANPVSIQFRYRNAAGERLAVSVAQAPAISETTGVARAGGGYGWHAGGRAYVVSGTPRPARLKTIAAMLRDAR